MDYIMWWFRENKQNKFGGNCGKSSRLLSIIILWCKRENQSENSSHTQCWLGCWEVSSTVKNHPLVFSRDQGGWGGRDQPPQRFDGGPQRYDRDRNQGYGGGGQRDGFRGDDRYRSNDAGRWGGARDGGELSRGSIASYFFFFFVFAFLGPSGSWNLIVWSNCYKIVEEILSAIVEFSR